MSTPPPRQDLLPIWITALSLALLAFLALAYLERRRHTALPANYTHSIAAAAHALALHLSTSTPVAIPDDDDDDNVRATAYLLGRYLSWSRLHLYHGQLLSASTDASHGRFTIRHRALEGVLADSPAGALAMSRLRQQGMAEAMTVWVPQHERWRCMGFREFCGKWEAEAEFRGWFAPVIEGRERMGTEEVAVMRRRLQHQLVGVLRVLSAEGPVVPDGDLELVDGAEGCECGIAKACERKEGQRT